MGFFVDDPFCPKDRSGAWPGFCDIDDENEFVDVILFSYKSLLIICWISLFNHSNLGFKYNIFVGATQTYRFISTTETLKTLLYWTAVTKKEKRIWRQFCTYSTFTGLMKCWSAKSLMGDWMIVHKALQNVLDYDRHVSNVKHEQVFIIWTIFVLIPSNFIFSYFNSM